MTVMIRKLAGTICVMSSSDEPGDFKNDYDDISEAKLLEQGNPQFFCFFYQLLFFNSLIPLKKSGFQNCRHF